MADEDARLGTLRLVSRDNGAGLSRDLRLIAEVLGRHHRVATMGFGANRMHNRLRQVAWRLYAALCGPVERQLLVERVYAPLLEGARCNLLMPNPEWFRPSWLRWLPRFERVLCKSHHAMDIFEQLGCRVTYVGFTSEDRLDVEVPRQRAFFHLAGRSSSKGTAALLAAWVRHPEWPPLTVVQNARKARLRISAANIDLRVGYLDDATLRRLQNAHRFHICPSEVEGYGHYIAEAMSVGAVVLTTDAAPMNELVTPACGVLLGCEPGARIGLDRRHLVGVADIEAGVAHALAMDDADCLRLGEAARERYVANDRAFRVRLAAAFALPEPMAAAAEVGVPDGLDAHAP